MAEVTGHIPRPGRGTTVVTCNFYPLENLQRVSGFCVDSQLGGSVEILMAQWTLAEATVGPVACDAALAEVVSAGSGDGFSEKF